MMVAIIFWFVWIALMFFQHQPDLEEFPLPKMDTLPDDPLKVILKNLGKVNRQVAKF